MSTQRPSRLNWVAVPPPGSRRVDYRPPPRPYTGPPSYPAPPRWGFPQVMWRWPTSVSGAAPEPVSAEGVRTTARLAATMSSITAVTAGVAMLAELLRYALLVIGLHRAVGPGLVIFSDTVVIAAGLVTLIFGFATLVLTLRWALATRSLAAQTSGRTPARSDLRMVLGCVVPGWNLLGPFAAFVELEHAVSGVDADTRPRPSALALRWWAAWLAGAALFVVTVVWSYRDTVQAIADGVLLHALSDASAVLVALLTARVVRELTSMAVPVTGSSPFRQVLSVRGAPATTERAPRPADAVR